MRLDWVNKWTIFLTAGDANCIIEIGVMLGCGLNLLSDVA